MGRRSGVVIARHRGANLPLPARKRWLILAPHPDDETLGAGALIAAAARDGWLAGVVYLTDGGGSHPVTGAARRTLVIVRKREAWRAVRQLAGPAAMRPVHLGWEDAHPPAPDGADYDRTRAALASIMRRRHVTALAVTALEDQHCDHAAAARLAYVCARDVGGHVAVFEYAVWAARVDKGLRPFASKPIDPARRRVALACHRSQFAGGASLLPGGARNLPDRDILYRRKPSHAPR